MRHIVWLQAFGLILLIVGIVHAQPPVTVEYLGNPCGARYPAGEWVYARNIWDMQAHGGLLYFGAGNSSNLPPAANAKGGEIWVYDPGTGEFRIDFRTDEEQVARFRVLDGLLTVPGHDPTDSWEFGNFYRLEKQGWRKYRNLPGGIHCFDLFVFGGDWFAALGGPPSGSPIVLRSRNGGRSWRECGVWGYRAFTFFTLGDNLYVSCTHGVERYNGRTFESCGDVRWLPGAGFEHWTPLIVKAVNAGPAVAYIAAARTNDHQWIPASLCAARSEDDVARVDVPGRIWDLLGRDGKAFALSNIAPDEGDAPHTIIVSTSIDLIHWSELFRFDAPTFARSFERLDGDFYFGLGCGTKRLAPETGSILRVRGISPR